MKGYIMGALCAKGHLRYDEKSSIYIISMESANRQLIGLLEDMFGMVFSVKPAFYEKSINGKKRFLLRINSKKLCRKLYYGMGLRTGASTWKIPKIAFADEECAKGFLCGYFDASSYIRIRVREKKGKREKIRNIRIVSPNKRGIESILRLLSKFGIHAISYSSGKNFCLDIEGKYKLELFEKRIGFLTDEKRLRLKDALSFLS